MAVVVSIATIIAQESHRVSFRNMLGVVLDKLLDAFPEGGDSLDVFVQTEHKTVLLVVFLHEAEWVIMNIAEQLDARLNAPVVFVVHHQRLTEEESRLKTAHVSVADTVAVNNLALGHVLANLSRPFLVDMRRERPMFSRDLTIVGLSRYKRRGHLLKCGIKWLVVEENPVVVVPAIEAVLDLADGLCNLPNVGVTGQGDKGSIDAGARLDSSQIIPASIVGCHGHGIIGRIEVAIRRGLRLWLLLDGRNGISLDIVGIAGSAATGRRLRFLCVATRLMPRLVQAWIERWLDRVGARNEIEDC